MRPYVGRFAPSPTGQLHMGSLVTALASRLDALAHQGLWKVRIDDIDTTRAQASVAHQILATLVQFGFAWDGPVVYQSERLDQYLQAFESLRQSNAVFPCSCSRREVDDAALPGVDGASIYPGTCRLGLAVRREVHSWRVRVEADTIEVHDRALGVQPQNLLREVGDFVIRRADGVFTYQLAVVVDDAIDEITDVVRGADLASSTARQMYLQRKLGLPSPRYLHIPIVTNASGEKLSKQTGAIALDPKQALPLLLEAARFLELGILEATSVPRFWELAPSRWLERFP